MEFDIRLGLTIIFQDHPDPQPGLELEMPAHYVQRATYRNKHSSVEEAREVAGTMIRHRFPERPHVVQVRSIEIVNHEEVARKIYNDRIVTSNPL